MFATLLVALLIGLPGTAPAAPVEARWRPATVVDDVHVWAAGADGEYWGYARGRVLASPEAIFRRIGDFESLPKVYPWLDRVRVLERGADTALVYFHYDLPWPLSDRSYTARHRWWTEASGTIVLDVEDANDEVPPRTTAPSGSSTSSRASSSYRRSTARRRTSSTCSVPTWPGCCRGASAPRRHGRCR